MLTAARDLVASLLQVLTVDHDPRFTAAALVTCTLVGLVGFRSILIGRDDEGAWRLFWFALAVVAFGAGVWTTHFLATMGWRPDLMLGLSADTTVLSGTIAVIGIGPPLCIAAAVRTRLADALGGAVSGVATAAMHGVGVTALTGCATDQGEGATIMGALGAAVCFALALRVLRKNRKHRTATAALLFTFGVFTLHFGTLAGTAIVALEAGPATALPRDGLLTAIIVQTLALLFTLIGAAKVQQRGEAYRQRLATVATSSSNAVLILDPTGHVQWTNAAFSHHTGYNLAAVLGKLPCSALSGPHTDPGAKDALCRAITAAQAIDVEILLRTAVGNYRWARAASRPVLDYAKRPKSQVLVLNDVTELKQRELELAEARDRAEQASRAKSQFISVMSHELRTPLNGVLGMAALLAVSPLNARQQVQVETISASGRQLLRTVDDILEISSEIGDLRPDTDFSVMTLLNELDEAVAPMASARGLTYRSDVAEDLPARLWGAQETVRRCVLRLAENAVRFTEKGEVGITLHRIEDLASESALAIDVWDTGVGVPPAMRERLFALFQQADSSATRTAGGIGLGLALCHRTVSALGGRLEYAPRPDGGSMFRIVLPHAVPGVATARGALPLSHAAPAA